MKVAVCFYGQPRYIEECAKALKTNLIDPLNADIYYHLWWDPSYIGQSFKFHATDKYEQDMSEVFKATYPDAVGVFEPQIQFDISNYSTVSGEQASYLSDEQRELWCKEVIFKQKSAFYSIRESVKQIRNLEQYDLIILTRVDVVPQKMWDTKDMFSKSKALNFDAYDNINHLADWFICGCSKLISVYSKLYDHIDSICNNEVLTTTSLIKRYCLSNRTFIRTTPFLVNIYRQYKEPTKMSDYNLTNKTNFPFWMK